MPLTIPASLAGLYVLSARMSAGIAHLRKTTAAAFKRVPGRVLIEINKKIGFRLVTKAGEKGVVNLAKLVPFVGGPVRAAFGGVGCRTIATYALSIVEPLPEVVVLDAEAMESD